MTSRMEELAGEKSFLYFLSEWAAAHAELTNEDTYLPSFDPQKLFERVSASVHYPHHPAGAVTEVLEEDHPDVRFNYGLGVADLEANAAFTQILFMMDELRDLMREIDLLIVAADRELGCPLMPSLRTTPVRLGSHLRAHLHYIELMDPVFRLGGSNGQLTVLKLAVDMGSAKAFARRLARGVGIRLDREIQVAVPQPRQALPPDGSPNEASFFSAASAAYRHRSLADALAGHVERGVLIPSHRERALHRFGEASGLLGRASSELLSSCFASGRRMDFEGWLWMHRGLQILYEVLENSCYDEDRILEELQNNPESLSELAAYYASSKEGEKHGCSMLRFQENPATDFHSALERMEKWDLF